MSEDFVYLGRRVHIRLTPITKRPPRWDWSYTISGMEPVQNMDDWARSRAEAVQDATSDAEHRIRSMKRAAPGGITREPVE